VSSGCVTDAELVARALAGDTAAFGELVDRHRVAVYRAARAALPSHADAEDAAQDAFLVAFERLGGFRGDASFKTWLLTIAWHQAINRRRSLSAWWRRLAQSTSDMETMNEHPASDPTPEQAAAAGELEAVVAREIRSLPERLRDALLLVHTGVHSYEEAAAMLRVPIGTLKWRVSEARRIVKRNLRERGVSHAG
jgi:RNA polymerase sigma-70 factor (ECF subfamily)